MNKVNADEILAAARAFLAAPDLGPPHRRICEYIRDHGGLVFAYSPPGNTRNLIQFESTPGGQYTFGSTDEKYRDAQNDPVFEKLFAEGRATELEAARLRENFEKLFPESTAARAALVVALRGPV
jgi:hypothetical protein